MKFNTGRTYYDSVTNDYRGEDTPDGIWLLHHKIAESPITLVDRRVALTVDKFYPYAYDMGNYATLSAKVDTAKPMRSIRMEIPLYDHIEALPSLKKVLEKVNAYNIRLFRRLMGIPEEYSDKQFLERLDVYGNGMTLRITGTLKLRRIGEKHLADGDILACTNPGKLFYLAEIEGK
jgi:hypothetical protein